MCLFVFDALLYVVNWEIIMICAAGGASAGAVGRWLIGRLRRGALVRAGPCELAGSVLCALTALSWTAGGLPGWWLPVPFAVVLIGVPLAAVDLCSRRLPDALTWPSYGVFGGALAIAALSYGRPGLLLSALLGMLLFGGAHLLVHLAAPGSLGAGDVKLAGSLGGVLGVVGWPGLLVATFLASICTLLLVVVGASIKRAWRCGVPHGPGLLCAVWAVSVRPGSGLGVGLIG